MTPPAGPSVRPGWKVLATSLAAIIPAIVALLLAFPAQVEQILEGMTNRLTRRDVLRGIQRAEVTEAIKAFDLEHQTRTMVVALQEDGALKIVWANPQAGLFWDRKGLRVGEIRYPSDDSVTRIVIEKCINGRRAADQDRVVACTILGNTHSLLTFPSPEGEVESIVLELARLAGRIDKNLLGI